MHKKITAFITSFTLTLSLLGISVFAEETNLLLYDDIVNDFELIEFTEEEQKEVDRYIESLHYNESDISLYSAKSTDYLFEYDFTKDFFYKQLNSEEKELYINMYNAAKRILNSDKDYELSKMELLYSAFCESILYSNTISSARAIEIYYAFTFSNPQFFFLGALGYSEGNLTLSTRGDFAKSVNRKEMKNTVRKKAELWLEEVNKYSNQLEKELRIIEILCSNITYDRTAIPGKEGGEYHQTIAGAIGKGQCVCNGYTMAFSYLCHLAKIDCIGIMGSGHAWNRVKLFGDWYEVDITLADGLTLNNVKVINGKWINKSTETFLANGTQSDIVSHTPRSDLYASMSLPACLKNDPTVPEYMPGDVNGDSKITAADLILVRRYMAHLSADISPVADLNGDGKINAVDLILLRRMYAQ